jgi:putative two-component system response regulator
MQTAALIARHHHERWDGSGYPDGVSGEGIPLAARIVAVADVFDALVHDRPYRKAWSEEAAIELILGGSGTHFDPRVVDAFGSLEWVASRSRLELECAV